MLYWDIGTGINGLVGKSEKRVTNFITIGLL